jgi:hypothetical protein
VSDFATVFVALFVAHQVADHWVQTDHQAQSKGGDGWHARAACAAHVVTYTATAAIALAVTVYVTGIELSPARAALGLAVSAVTHYVADRRTPLRRMAATFGKGAYWDRGGAYPLDQSFHYLWLWVAALICA